ncbi:MAG: hypothetical protein BGO68_05140 [Candidatus Amoebophilus sp. 36-38]|nr:MAG: hypothetical protein BGO68_05140 [Candidatus Amoebophilus sp. 36-38]
MEKKYDCVTYTYDQDGRCLLLQELIEDIAAYIKKLDVTHSDWDEIEIFSPASTLAILMGNDDSRLIGKVVNPRSKYIVMTEKRGSYLLV